MESVIGALNNLNSKLIHRSRKPPVSFEEFLCDVVRRPSIVLRNIFQVFHDMIEYHIGEGIDEYPNDPESIHYVYYDCSRLFEEKSDRPFFADRLFANRLVNLVESMKRGAQQNKIYIFNGPPGCGKSTFLNNLLRKFESYVNSEDGMRYELVWRIDPKLFGSPSEISAFPVLEQLAAILSSERGEISGYKGVEAHVPVSADGCIEVPCPSHDNPILIIPKNLREDFLRDLFKDSPFKERLFTDREYHWIFRDKPCTFCSALYRALLNLLKNPSVVHKMVYARHYRFNRRVGEGISVFSPGDQQPRNNVVYNPAIQARLNSLLKSSTEVHYLFSRYAKTNNGVYALMDIKGHNTERFIELHNIISEGVHKVEDTEENVNSLLLAIMNPEDQKNIKEFKSFSDRIDYINIPYVMDMNTEVKIYKNTFGKQIEERFLPRVLTNFARVIISSRLTTRSEALLEWIGEARKYNLFCDDNLQLLKMEIYSGVIPPWLTEDDRKKLTAQRRRRIIAESDREGASGISGRDSIRIFNEFYSTYGKHEKLINMSMLCEFFTRKKRDLMQSIPSGFLDSLVRMYNYTVLQEVKESLYYYNEHQIARDIMNYLFAINFEAPANEVCTWTKDHLKITDDFFNSIESRFLGAEAGREHRREFRESTQKEYTSKTLTQEIMLERKAITQTEIFRRLHQRYVQNIKEKVLDPFLDNDNFRRAIKDYNLPDFKTYDKRIRVDVRYLIRNLQRKFGYTEQGAREVCIYVIDNDLARTFPSR
jgi:predicted Ser/Thr protein kinase